MCEYLSLTDICPHVILVLGILYIPKFQPNASLRKRKEYAMKKLVIYILLLTIVFSVTACSDPYGLYTIDDVDALKEEVDAALGRETFWMDYYVSCNGYHIIAYPSDIMVEGDCYKHIAGYEFVCFS